MEEYMIQQAQENIKSATLCAKLAAGLVTIMVSDEANYGKAGGYVSQIHFNQIISMAEKEGLDPSSVKTLLEFAMDGAVKAMEEKQ